MADFVVNYDSNIYRCTYDALQASSLRGLINPKMRVAIKPNMVLARPPNEGATTHSEVVEALIVFLREQGVESITIMEGAWVGDDTKRAYRVCGFDRLAKKHGVGLVDLKDGEVKRVHAMGFTLDICKEALGADFLINVPVLKAHCQTGMTCNLKNLKGCLPDKEKRRFHTLGLHRPIAYLNKALKTGFCLVDGICGDLTFEEGGNPVWRNMVIAGEDPVLIDSYCAGLIGLDVSEVAYLGIAESAGVGRMYDGNADIVELNMEKKPRRVNAESRMIKELSEMIEEDGACSACYAALIFALHQSGIRKMSSKIKIGQGFRGKTVSGIGCGNCTKEAESFAKGCPPAAADILKILRNR